MGTARATRTDHHTAPVVSRTSAGEFTNRIASSGFVIDSKKSAGVYHRGSRDLAHMMVQSGGRGMPLGADAYGWELLEEGNPVIYMVQALRSQGIASQQVGFLPQRFDLLGSTQSTSSDGWQSGQEYDHSTIGTVGVSPSGLDYSIETRCEIGGGEGGLGTAEGGAYGVLGFLDPMDRPALYKRWSQVSPARVAADSLNEPVSFREHDRLAKEQADLHQQLRSYADLPENWDGEGATTPSAEAIENAIQFLYDKPVQIPLPSPDIGSAGEVGVYWDENGIFAEAVFEGDGHFHYYAEHVVDDTVHTTTGKDGLAVGDDWPEGLVRLLTKLVS